MIWIFRARFDGTWLAIATVEAVSYDAALDAIRAGPHRRFLAFRREHWSVTEVPRSNVGAAVQHKGD